MRRPAPSQPLLLDWHPAEPYPEDAVRAATLAQRISRGVAQTLRDNSQDRRRIAERMGAYLGEAVSVTMLDAYASQARGGHNISAVRLAALVHVTGDERLLGMPAEPLGLAVIPARMLPLLDLAEAHEEAEAARRKVDAIRRLAREGLR